MNPHKKPKLEQATTSTNSSGYIMMNQQQSLTRSVHVTHSMYSTTSYQKSTQLLVASTKRVSVAKMEQSQSEDNQRDSQQKNPVFMSPASSRLQVQPIRFAAVIMRIREPKTTALIFSSGKMVCTGAKSEEKSKLAVRKYARIVQKLGFPARFSDFQIKNMVGSVDVNFPIRLEGLAVTHSQFARYEPELFPGLIYRMVKPRIVLLIFASGKVVMTGAKMRSEIKEAFNSIYPILKGFKQSSGR